MADFTKNTIADMASASPGINMGTTGSLHDIDWGVEDDYWRANYASRPYASADRPYDYYRPAYRYGAESRARHARRPWNEVESDLATGWTTARGDSAAEWNHVRDAVRDAYDRTER